MSWINWPVTWVNDVGQGTGVVAGLTLAATRLVLEYLGSSNTRATHFHGWCTQYTLLALSRWVTARAGSSRAVVKWKAVHHHHHHLPLHHKPYWGCPCSAFVGWQVYTWQLSVSICMTNPRILEILQKRRASACQPGDTRETELPDIVHCHSGRTTQAQGAKYQNRQTFRMNE